jgi:hypothetical protein
LRKAAKEAPSDDRDSLTEPVEPTAAEG